MVNAMEYGSVLAICEFKGITSSPRQKGEAKAIKPVPSMMFIATKWRKVVTVSNRWSQNQWTGMASGVGINDAGSMLGTSFQKVNPGNIFRNSQVLLVPKILLKSLKQLQVT